jgi:endonuclease/exonuclease/phosphatase (EEP) superfamily protein YafD
MSAQARRRVEQVAGALAAVVAAAVALSVLAGVLSDGAWPWVVATYLRWSQTLAITVATGVLIATRWWRSGLVAGLVTVGLIASLVAPLRALTTVPAPDGETLRIVVFNTGPGSGDVDAIAEAIAGARPDVAVLLESEDIAERLDRRLDGLELLPTPTGSPVTAPPSVMARRDWPLTVEPLDDGRPVSIVTAEIGGRPLDVVGMHPLPPVTRRWARSHDRSISALTGTVLPRSHPYVLACDCNTAPWTPSMRRLLDAGLRQPTVAATFGAPVIGVPTDHVLLGSGVAAVSRELGPFAGSDHRLIMTEVTLKS